MDIGEYNPFYSSFNSYPLIANLDGCGECNKWSSATLRTTSEKIALEGLDQLANLETIVMERGDIKDPSPFLLFQNLTILSLYQQKLERVDALLGLPDGMTEIGLQENDLIQCADVDKLRKKYGVNIVFSSQCPISIE